MIILVFGVSSLGKVVVGGFFIGGVFLVDYMFKYLDNVKGLMLFFGVLVLNGNVELLLKIWGMCWLVKMFDGDYKIDGLNL